MQRILILALCLNAFGLPLVYSDSPELALSSKNAQAPQRRHKLQSLLANERLKLRILEAENQALKEKRREAEKKRLEKTLELGRLERPDLKLKSLYYQSEEKPVTAEGHFYETAQNEKIQADEKMERLNQELAENRKQILNQKRLVLEKLVRLKNYDEATREAWEQNPF